MIRFDTISDIDIGEKCALIDSKLNKLIKCCQCYIVVMCFVIAMRITTMIVDKGVYSELIVQGNRIEYMLSQTSCVKLPNTTHNHTINNTFTIKSNKTRNNVYNIQEILDRSLNVSLHDSTTLDKMSKLLESILENTPPYYPR